MVTRNYSVMRAPTLDELINSMNKSDQDSIYFQGAPFFDPQIGGWCQLTVK